MERGTRELSHVSRMRRISEIEKHHSQTGYENASRGKLIFVSIGLAWRRDESGLLSASTNACHRQRAYHCERRVMEAESRLLK